MMRSIVLSLAFSVAGCGASPTTPGSRAHAPVDGERPLDAQERAAFQDIVTWAESVRDLRATRPIDVVAVDTATLRAIGESIVDDAHRPGRATTFAELGLVDGATDASELSEALGETLAGASTKAAYTFDPARVVLHADTLPSLDSATNLARDDQLVVLHEVVHALQHQRLMTGGLADGDVELDPDRDLALRSLVEGDATIAMIAALARSTGVPLESVVAERRLVGRFAEIALASSIILPTGFDEASVSGLARTRLFAPYFLGAAFVASRYAEGGWRAVDAVYADAGELSCEHLLHPEKFGTADVREPIAPPELASLGTPGARIDETTLGELIFRVYADPLGRALASRAAEGWAGDRIRTYRRPDGTIATVWITTWDSIRDAAEAADAARRVHAATSNDARARLVIRTQRAVLIATGLSAAESDEARTLLESWVFESLSPIDHWPPAGE